MDISSILSIFGSRDNGSSYGIKELLREQQTGTGRGAQPTQLGYMNALDARTRDVAARFDNDKNGTLSLTESDLSAMTFERIDRDSDQSLTIGELNQEFARLDANRDLQLSWREVRSGYPRIDIWV